MTKLEFLPAADNEEHLQRHSDSSSLTIGSKALSTTSKEDISKILSEFDNAYKSLIEKNDNPGRTVLALRTDRWVGTDPVVPYSEVDKDTVFKITREPGTRGEAEIKVALVEPQDMPKTNVVHAIYGPYGPTGQGGIYTMMFGDPGEPFPRNLDENADERTIALNNKAKEYWEGKDGKEGHVFLVTPAELEEAVKQMDIHGIPTKSASYKLNRFKNDPKSPIISHTETQVSPEAQNLGKIYLKPLVLKTKSNQKE